MTLLQKIESEIDNLNVQDIGGHIWWAKFLDLVKEYAQKSLPTEQEITAEAKKRYAHWPQKQVEFTEGAMFAINKES